VMRQNRASGTSFSPQKPHRMPQLTHCLQLPIQLPPPCAPPAASVIKPRNQKRVSVSARKQKRSCYSAVKQSRHTFPCQRVTFSLPPLHVDKDSMIWRRRCPPNERTTYCIDPLRAHSPSPTITPLPGHPHPIHGILATSTSGAACLVYYI
jgi:hypothetical protein